MAKEMETTATATSNSVQQRPLEGLIGQLAAIEPIVAVAADHAARFWAREQAKVAAAAASRAGSVAILPMMGGLVPRGERSQYGGYTGMEGFRRDLRALGDNNDVTAIVLDVDSPGGTVAGTTETAATVREVAAKKPVVAVANTLMASAAYWIGSQASQLIATPYSDIGSIGAMALHIDISKALEDFGIKLSMISSAPNKNEAAFFRPLSDETRAYLQSRVDAAGDDFIKAIAEGRKVTQATVRENYGQGRVFSASAALARGMVDKIATLDEVIAGLTQKPSSGSSRNRRRSSLAFDT